MAKSHLFLSDEQMKTVLQGKYMTYMSVKWINEECRAHPNDVSLMQKAQWEYERALKLGMIKEND